MSRNDDTPADGGVGTPAAHWGTKHPEDQPPRNTVMGLGRMVQEAKDRLGPGATVEAVVQELKALGADVSAADVSRLIDHPYA